MKALRKLCIYSITLNLLALTVNFTVHHWSPLFWTTMGRFQEAKFDIHHSSRNTKVNSEDSGDTRTSPSRETIQVAVDVRAPIRNNPNVGFTTELEKTGTRIKLPNEIPDGMQVTYFMDGYVTLVEDNRWPVAVLPRANMAGRAHLRSEGDFHRYENLLRSLGAAVPAAKRRLSLPILLRPSKRLPRKVRPLQETLRKFIESPDYFLCKSPQSLNYLLAQMDVLSTRVFPREKRSMDCSRCFVNNFRTILEPRSVCEGGEAVEIVALITSVPENIAEREAVRKTWGSYTRNNKSNFRLIFLFGGGWSKAKNAILKRESDLFGDILQEDYIDGYYNLTYKVISGFRWVSRTCSQAKFVMRGADDCYVNMTYIFDLFNEYGDHPRFTEHQVGQCYVDFKPYWAPDFKGFLSGNEYSMESFPPYALGTIYFTSASLTREIVTKSEYIPFFPIEDAYIGLVLWPMGRGCHHISGFQYTWPDVPKDKPLTTVHMVPAYKMYKLHEQDVTDV